METAGFWLRAAAFVLDYAVVAAYAGALFLVTRLFPAAEVSRAANEFLRSPALFDLFAFLILVMPVTLYFALCESSVRQATWGKRRLRLRVTSSEGARIRLPRSLVRSGLKFLPWQIAHTSLFHIPGWPFAVHQIPPGALAGLGIASLLVVSYLVMLAFDRSHRTPYDRVAGTQVTRSRPNSPI